jgi:hypothetical protein
VPFSVVLALASIGAVVVWRRPIEASERAWKRALAWWIGGQLVAVLVANLLFFTSAQHRLPLIVPLVILAGPGAIAVVEQAYASLRSRPGPGIARGWWIVALLLVGQGMWPRIDRSTPHPVHYYNLAVVQDEIGEPLAALRSLDRAIELRPDQPAFHGARAHLRLRIGDLEGAEQDLDQVFAAESAPAWVLDRAGLDRASIAWERQQPSSR